MYEVVLRILEVGKSVIVMWTHALCTVVVRWNCYYTNLRKQLLPENTVPPSDLDPSASFRNRYRNYNEKAKVFYQVGVHDLRVFIKQIKVREIILQTF